MRGIGFLRTIGAALTLTNRTEYNRFWRAWKHAMINVEINWTAIRKNRNKGRNSSMTPVNNPVLLYDSVVMLGLAACDNEDDAYSSLARNGSITSGDVNRRVWPHRVRSHCGDEGRRFGPLHCGQHRAEIRTTLFCMVMFLMMKCS